MIPYDPNKPPPPPSTLGELNSASLLSLSDTLTSPISGSVNRFSVIRDEERGVELDPIARFENQVVSQWLPHTQPERYQHTMSLYADFKAKKYVEIVSYSAKTLASMQVRGKIKWCEPVLDGQKIDGITFPMNPEYNLLMENVGGPVIFVGSSFDREHVTVLQGNHRTAAVILRGRESNESLYVVRFKSSRYSQELLRTSPDGGWSNPQLPEKYASDPTFGVYHG